MCIDFFFTYLIRTQDELVGVYKKSSKGGGALCAETAAEIVVRDIIRSLSRKNEIRVNSRGDEHVRDAHRILCV
jgi:hypothetical protein